MDADLQAALAMPVLPPAVQRVNQGSGKRNAKKKTKGAKAPAKQEKTPKEAKVSGKRAASAMKSEGSDCLLYTSGAADDM
eukprot:2653962-Alexandrium_andersonii.AAC.1